MEKILIDANVIVRFLLKDNIEHFNKAFVIFSRLYNKQIFVEITEGVLLEVFYVLTKFYWIEKTEVISFLIVLLSEKNIVCWNKEILVNWLNISLKYNLDLVDWFLVAKSLNENIKIKTFDKKLLKVLNKYSNAD